MKVKKKDKIIDITEGRVNDSLPELTETLKLRAEASFNKLCFVNERVTNLQTQLESAKAQAEEARKVFNQTILDIYKECGVDPQDYMINTAAWTFVKKEQPEGR